MYIIFYINYIYRRLTYCYYGKKRCTQFQIVYQLTKPYTVGLIAPKISIEFNTSEAIGAGRDNLGTCLFWPAEPYVSVSISE